LKHPLFREEIDSMKKKRKRKNDSVIESIAFSARRLLVVLFMSPLLLSLSVDFFNNDPITIVAAFHVKFGHYNYAIPPLTKAGSCCRLGKEVVSGGRRWKMLNHQSLRRSCTTTYDSHSDNNSLTEHPKPSTFMGIRSIGVDYGTVRTGVAISRYVFLDFTGVVVNIGKVYFFLSNSNGTSMSSCCSPTLNLDTLEALPQGH
jgi:hypothetical protein